MEIYDYRNTSPMKTCFRGSLKPVSPNPLLPILLSVCPVDGLHFRAAGLDQLISLLLLAKFSSHGGPSAYQLICLL